jgi:hypothetical protein
MIELIVAAMFFWMLTAVSFVFSFLLEPPPIVLHLFYGYATRGPIGRKVHTAIMGSVAMGLTLYGMMMLIRRF